MKVKELIELLKDFDPEMTVITFDNDYGVDEPGTRRVKVNYKCYPEDFYYSSEEGYEDIDAEEVCCI